MPMFHVKLVERVERTGAVFASNKEDAEGLARVAFGRKTDTQEAVFYDEAREVTVEELHDVTDAPDWNVLAGGDPWEDRWIMGSHLAPEQVLRFQRGPTYVEFGWPDVAQIVLRQGTRFYATDGPGRDGRNVVVVQVDGGIVVDVASNDPTLECYVVDWDNARRAERPPEPEELPALVPVTPLARMEGDFSIPPSAGDWKAATE